MCYWAVGSPDRPNSVNQLRHYLIFMYLLNRPVLSSLECAEYARDKWIKIKDLESVYAMYLNSKFEVQHFTQINTSNYRETNFNAREAIKPALFFNFDHIILFHNHTSGNCNPSEIDKKLTFEALPHYDFFKVNLFDHIILTVNDHYSFLDHHLLQTG